MIDFVTFFPSKNIDGDIGVIIRQVLFFIFVNVGHNCNFKCSNYNKIIPIIKAKQSIYVTEIKIHGKNLLQDGTNY